MTHPEELLAGFVDGSLTPGERTLVEEHLRTCFRCRDETALAIGARTAIASLEEADAPADVGLAAIEEANAGRPPAAAAPRRNRIVAIAAAAATIALIAVVVPHIGRSPATSVGAPGAERSPVIAAGNVPLVVRRTNYDPASLAELATGHGALSGDVSSFSPIAIGGADRAASTDAIACLDRAFRGFSGTPVGLIRARFEGIPAYIGVYLESPGPGLPADARSARVASVATCTILSSSRAKL